MNKVQLYGEISLNEFVEGNSMALNYRKATIADLEILSYEYYQKSLENDTHLAYLIFDDEKFVGAGGISYFQVMPTYHRRLL